MSLCISSWIWAGTDTGKRPEEVSAYCTMAETGLEYLNVQGNTVTGQIPNCLLAAGTPFPSMDHSISLQCTGSHAFSRVTLKSPMDVGLHLARSSAARMAVSGIHSQVREAPFGMSMQ